MEDRFATTLTIAVTLVVVAVTGAIFLDCQKDREAREECMRNSSRSAAECLQAFPTGRGR